MRRTAPLTSILFVFIITLSTPFATQSIASSRRADQCFNVSTIDNCLDGRFQEFWSQSGGLPVFGYPITAQRLEFNEDTGQAYETQWLERNRFELHPENKAPYDVQLGRLGAEVLLREGRDWNTFPKADPATPHFFAQTGHSIAEQFWSYWSRHGLEQDGKRGTSYAESLALFGLPLSEAQMETSVTDGKTYLTQWFERARFEYHPENPRESQVLLGLLGNEMIRNGTPAPQGTGFNFERGTEGWNTSEESKNTLAVTTRLVHSGNAALQVNTLLLGGKNPEITSKNDANLYRHTEITAYFDRAATEGLATVGAQNLANKHVSCYVYAPGGLLDKTGNSTYMRIFVKDKKYANHFGVVTPINENNVDQWTKLSINVGVHEDGDDLGSDFDATQTNALGIRIETPDDSTLNYTGPIYIDECTIE